MAMEIPLKIKDIKGLVEKPSLDRSLFLLPSQSSRGSPPLALQPVNLRKVDAWDPGTETEGTSSYL